MYTANTMASAIEALGMSLPNSSAQNAVSPATRATIAAAPARRWCDMVREGISRATS